MKRLTTVALLLCLVASVSCIRKETPVNLTPEQRFFAVAEESIRQASNVYEAVLPIAGEAYAAGAITEAQLAVVRASGIKVDKTLTQAQNLIAGYLRGLNTRSEAEAAINSVYQELPGLVDLLAEYGVHLNDPTKDLLAAALVLLETVLQLEVQP